MPVTDYPSKIVLVGYFVQEQEAGTVAEREKFSQEIFGTDITRTSSQPVRPPSRRYPIHRRKRGR